MSHLTGITPRSEKNVTMTAAESLDGYRLVDAGDLVINTMWAWMGALGVSKQVGIVSPAYGVYRPRPNAAFYPGFYDYLYRSTPYVMEMTRLSRGIWSSRLRIYPDVFLSMAIPVPPLEEQRAIADYLDRETARIDTLIEEQQRLIEMLRERRGAMISNAVARGLDETVALKDSGLPGAGPVPAHWEIMPLRYTISFQEGPGIMAADFRDAGVPLLRVSSVRTARSTLEGCNYLDPDEVDRRWSHFRVDLGDLLISASASMGTVSEVTEETIGAVPYTGIIRIKPGCMHKDFIRWFVVSGEFIDQVDSLKTGSTIQHFGPTHLAQMRVALPPTDEQRRIAAYLDEQAAKIDKLITETERCIELAQERRAALITAAVTGQTDLREAA
ncbi:restriction endonuclease subunit S [Streptomyces iranensis]|uniref:Restriction modification system DNA specificitysubunit n=1 Tax=Streptomyces iranensis TaxID=576784 RepID=A0A060ZMJ2_9ACTN|nr:restriction endonuclease subunit S [Streptomyces iranensis]MBP2067810.1 type I restriction enzyme S subunit [Streptomyces iranensis]CDR06974.1 restriction modification system DNA specificitysubunit [Streptomyces iranensis]